MKRFKQEFQNCTVTINSPSIGRMTIDTSTADPNEWAKLKEFEHMTEDDVQVPTKKEAVKEIKEPNYSEMSLNDLREIFPDIKATSKKAFLEQIQ